jgi:hypothetical protein
MSETKTKPQALPFIAKMPNGSYGKVGRVPPDLRAAREDEWLVVATIKGQQVIGHVYVYSLKDGIGDMINPNSENPALWEGAYFVPL